MTDSCAVPSRPVRAMPFAVPALPALRGAAGSSARALAALQALLVGAMLFGDWLALTVSRLATGSSGNWLLVTAALQPLAIAASLAVGHRRRAVPWLTVLGWAGLCAVAAAHAVPLWLAGDELSDYGAQKLLCLVFVAGPALAVGLLLGCGDELPGARVMPWFTAPLLALCAAALAVNPRLLTIEHFADPPVWLGFLVMPTHQALAFCLAKAALLCFALDARRALAASTPGAAARRVRFVRLAVVGGLLGLVLLTGARAYAVALAAALAAQALLGGRRLGLLIVGSLGALLLWNAYASDVVLDRFDPARLMESLAYREREAVWHAAWSAFAEQPFAGVGLGGFAQHAGWHGRVYPHNLPLEIASELGIAGLCCLFAMLAPPAVRIAAALRRGERPGPVASFGVGMAVFGLGGALAVGDLIRNHHVFFAIGLCATAFGARRPAAPAAEVAAP